MAKRRQPFKDKKTQELISRYQNMQKAGGGVYFDILELEWIIEYFLQKGKYKMAKEACYWGLHLHPASMRLRYREAQLLLSERQYDKVVSLLSPLLAIEPANPEYRLLAGMAHLYLKDIASAHACFEESYRNAGADHHRYLLRIAHLFYETDNFKEALPWLTKAYRQAPDNQQTLQALALTYDKLGKSHKSLAYFEKYLAERPFAQDAWLLSGKLAIDLGDYDRALAAFDYALAIDPDFHLALLNKANAHYLVGQYTKAIESYQLLLAEDSSYANLHLYIADCFYHEKDLLKALDHYKEALEEDQSLDVAWFGCALVLRDMGHPFKSVNFLKIAVKLNPGNPNYLLCLARLYKQMKFNRKASKSYAEVLAFAPERLSLWLEAIDYQYYRKDFNEALKLIGLALKAHPHSASLHYRLAATQLRNQQSEQAGNSLQTALKLDFERHGELFELCPEARRHSEICQLIDQYQH